MYVSQVKLRDHSGEIGYITNSTAGSKTIQDRRHILWLFLFVYLKIKVIVIKVVYKYFSSPLSVSWQSEVSHIYFIIKEGTFFEEVYLELYSIF